MPAVSRTAREAPTEALPTRELILDRAERLFAARGLDGVAVRDLAREMKITPSSLYNHFPGKQALYAAVLQRGVEPIMEMVADAWQRGVSRREDVRATMAVMVPHLAAHPHLARLLQRAMLEESAEVRVLIARWIDPLYREGLSVVGKMAGDAGWQPADAPHLVMMLFEMIFGYFANAAALQQITGWTDDPLSETVVAHQQRILEEAIFRLLGPKRQRARRKRRK
jgi:TetR/AcrR family transcriptional regulator